MKKVKLFNQIKQRLILKYSFKLRPISNYPDQNVHEICKQVLLRHDDKVKKSHGWKIIQQVGNQIINFDA